MGYATADHLAAPTFLVAPLVDRKRDGGRPHAPAVPHRLVAASAIAHAAHPRIAHAAHPRPNFSAARISDFDGSYGTRRRNSADPN